MNKANRKVRQTTRKACVRSPLERVRAAILLGYNTQLQMREVSGLNPDELTDSLAQLLDRKEIKTEPLQTNFHEWDTEHWRYVAA